MVTHPNALHLPSPRSTPATVRPLLWRVSFSGYLKHASAWTFVQHLDLTLTTRFPSIQTTTSGVFFTGYHCSQGAIWPVLQLAAYYAWNGRAFPRFGRLDNPLLRAAHKR